MLGRRRWLPSGWLDDLGDGGHEDHQDQGDDCAHVAMVDQLPAHVQQGGLLSLEPVQKQKVDRRVVVVRVLHY